MHRRTMLLGAAGLTACTGAPIPFNSKLKPQPITAQDYDFEFYDKLYVTDVSRTDLGGTVIYDEVIPFDVGQFTPPTSSNPNGQGGRITGAVQTRVVRSATTNTLIFAYRFREMTFEPGFGPQKKGSQLVFIELVAIQNFPKSALPYEIYLLMPTQSLGAAPLNGYYRGGGDFEFNTQLIDPGGTTFFEVLTSATRFTTGKHMNFEVDTRGNNGGVFRHTLDKIAIPA